MNPAICGWDTARFLIFSDNVFDHLIYYSHLGPLLVALVMGMFVFFTNRKDLINKLLLAIIFFFCIWIFFDLILWATEKTEFTMFFWSSMIFLDLLIYSAALYFIYVFTYQKDLSLFGKILISLPFLPLIFFAPTNYNLEFFDFTNCDRDALEGILWRYTYLVEIIYVLFIFTGVFLGFSKAKRENKLKELLFVSSGVILFLIAFSWGNIAGNWTDDWSAGQYGLFGFPIFIGFLTYSIVKFKIFNTKLIGAQALVIALILLIGSQFFFIKTTINFILTGVTLVLSIGFGWALIRSIKQEVKRKEELQRISDNLAATNERLKELDNAKSEFISIASHQLRTPLTAIKGYTSLLLEGSYGKVAPAIQDVLDKVYTINNRLVQLVENLLNVSRIEAGRIQYNFELIWLEPLVAEIVDTFAITAKNKNLTLTFNHSKQMLPQLTLDPNKIKEVVSNLIDNAIKYTKKGGVNVSVEAKEGAARIIISDTGIGIHPSDKIKLFEKFTRSKETASMVVSGSGLGLYVGKSFVQAHGGKIWAESEGLGRGSRFIVELPFLNPNVKIGISEQFSTLGRGK